MIKLELTLEEINGVLGSLGKMPYELAYPLIDKIKAQAIPQIPAPEAPVEVVAE